MTTSGIIAFSTSNYDAMIKLLSDFGFKVTQDPHDQLTPLFNQERGSHCERGDLFFNLEESSSGKEKASFNLFLTDFTDEELERVKTLGYKGEYGASLYGEFLSFRTPDGGTFVV